MKTYKIKKIITGALVKKELRGKSLVGIPQGRGYTSVIHNGDLMHLKDKKILAISDFFFDKYGRTEPYRLLYYEWIPDIKQMVLF